MNPRGRTVVRWAIVAAMLAMYYTLALSAAAHKSMTFDEMAHLTGGYTYWAFNDYRLHPENGNWPQRLAALPAVIGHAAFPRLDQPAWRNSNVYAIGDQFLYSTGNDADTLLRRGRAVMGLLGVALGALVYAWTRRLVSPAAAWVSLVLFVFSPTLLAHGPLVTSDTASALFFTASVGAMWAVLHRATPTTVLGGAVLLAGAFLSKLSAPILIPVAMLMIVVRLVDGRPLVLGFGRRRITAAGWGHQLGVISVIAIVLGLVTWGLIWASFGFRYTAFAAATSGTDKFLGETIDPAGAVGSALSAARRFHLLPEAYIYGSTLTVEFASERAAFLNGAFSTRGWWWYFPYAFLVKTTIPAMLIGILAFAALARRWTRAGDTWVRRTHAAFYEFTPLLALVAIYGAFALTTNLNIGHRHLLPMYPAFCIIAGAAGGWIEPLVTRTGAAPPENARERRKPRTRAQMRVSASVKAASVATMVLLAWHVAESVAIRPDYLAYFNELAGGPANGYKHLADSSLDWGQDLPTLKRWLDQNGLQNGGGTGVYLSYFGTARPEYYGIRATPLAGFIDRRPPQPPDPLGGGVYAISATMLDVIGHTFYEPEYEGNYQAAIKNLAAFARASESETEWAALMKKTGEPYWQQVFAQFDRLRTGRLLAFLRHRPPDAMVGYSILIYRLSDGDVESALAGPPPDVER